MKYCQLVIGPAGSGKSTYCATIQDHCKTVGRTVFVVNLDPAAEVFKYECAIDIRDLIDIDDVLEANDMDLGPNGGLVFCMEYLIENGLDWLHDQLNEAEDDYFLFDCPGQIELYSHLSVMRQIVDALRQWDFNVCTTFILDTSFCLDADKFLAATLTTLSTMVALETPSINVLGKMDLLSKPDTELINTFLEGDISEILCQESGSKWNERHRKLTEALATVLDDYSLIKFIPLDPEDEEGIADLMIVIDERLQFGENADVKDRFPTEEDQ